MPSFVWPMKYAQRAWRTRGLKRFSRTNDEPVFPETNAVGAPPPAPVRRNPARKRRSGGFPTPTLTGGLKVPPPIRATPAPPGPSEGNRGEEGGKNVPPPGGQVFSEVPHRPASGMIPRETDGRLSILVGLSSVGRDVGRPLNGVGPSGEPVKKLLRRGRITVVRGTADAKSRSTSCLRRSRRRD